MHIRRVNLKDLQAFARLYKLSYKGLEEYAYIKDRDIKDYFRWLLKRDPEGFLIVELSDPVAFIACDTNWFSPLERKFLGEIHEIFVHPDYRGIGIGSVLLERAVNHSRSKGRELMGLWVGMKNLFAKEFYRKRGFIETISLGKWTRMIKKI
ncbi:MAG: GNAT family N-acetyltransferase [Candidatus Bathyarchaeia archaeon]